MILLLSGRSSSCDEASAHWSTMIDSSGEQVCRWHSLIEPWCHRWRHESERRKTTRVDRWLGNRKCRTFVCRRIFGTVRVV